MKFLVVTGVLFLLASVSNAEGPHGLQILSKYLRQYLNALPEDVKLGDGVHIVSTRSENDARANIDDGTLLGAVENYLETHEVKIKLQDLMPSESFGRAFKTALDEADGKKPDESSPRGGGGGIGGGGGKGGGGGGGGGGGVMIMGLMMGKLLAALGIGGVGLLAMKALMVSALALMLSVIIGLKKLVHHDDHDYGHHVIHAGHGHGHEHYHDHYRKKREAADMAYQSWNQYKPR